MSDRGVVFLLESIKSSDEPSSWDQMFVAAVLSSKDQSGVPAGAFADSKATNEFRSLVLEAMELDRRSDFTLSDALAAHRAMVTAQERGDRRNCVRHGEAALRLLDQARYPLTCGMTCLVLGTTWAALSNEDEESSGKPGSASLARSVEYLEKSIPLLRHENDPTMAANAHYNLALAYAGGKLPHDEDWDDAVGKGHEDAALYHGIEALKAMDNGHGVGNRVALSNALVKILVERGGHDRGKPLDQAIDILERLLASREGKSSKKDTCTMLALLYRSKGTGDQSANEKRAKEYDRQSRSLWRKLF